MVWVRNNILYIITIGLLAFTLKGQIEKTRELEQTIKDMREFQTQTIENAKPVAEALRKSPKATKQMEKIAEKKPKMLEKRMNVGFQKLADELMETTK
ncbi:hypothetical protein UGMREWDR_CDS0018 [Aeromonas phage GomatiRiver_11]|nr:hypothetical protein OBDJBBDK_00018 [Aeromonas phage AhFM11]WKW84185.1 hypothetical protein UGMREWDR_CDS0018 [Aeromonas phage GomatiRiver_11]